MIRAMRSASVLRVGIPSLLVLLASVPTLKAAGKPDRNTTNSLARQILQDTGVRGGLVVHAGCGGGRLTAALCASDSYLVHGLDVDPGNVDTARKQIQSLGLYGRVSVETFGGEHLPYTDNLVNLLVAEDLGRLPMSEVMRVLAPRGVAMIGGKKTVKPWPKDIDQWTHFLHDATGNAVAKDDRVGPPRRIQWMAGPKRTRDHDALASLSAMTSSEGRIFYILDEGPTSLTHRPPEWKLIARDAFNGVLLWKREIPTWMTHLLLFRSGPAQLARRLVSVGDRVYATLGFDAPVTMLDAATGKDLLTFEGSRKTEELIVHDDTLLAVIGDPNILIDEAPKVYGYWELSVNREPQVAKSIVAYQADTGRILWKKTGANLAHLVPLSLVACGKKAFFMDNENLYCVDLKTGEDLWKAPFRTSGLFLRNYAPTVVAHEDVVMCLTWNRFCSFSIRDGKKLWEHKGAIGFASPGDLFAIDGLAWTVPMTASIWKDNRLGRDGKVASGINIPRENFLGNGGTEIWGIDVRTGEVKATLPRNKLLPGGHHHRCYRNKATERYLICGRRGLEYIDLAGDDHVNNWWVRGICQYGVMPANGHIYVPPDPCQCFNLIKVNYLLALSARNSLDDGDFGNGQTLQKGPAYRDMADRRKPAADETGSGSAAPAATDGPVWQPPIYDPQSDWPTYRGNITRSGSTKSPVPVRLSRLWQTDVGGNLSASVVADKRLLVCSKQSHTVNCLDAESGRALWQFVANGPVDSPPTIYDGLCVFGCSDGAVYCLRADDGKLVWRAETAPVDRRVVAGDRLESVWPVHGSVLVHRGVAYVAAGRSSYLDGGIHLYGLDVYSGKTLHRASVSAAPIRPGKPSPKEESTGALPDVLVSDGEQINMRHVQFDRNLVQRDTAEIRTLLSTTGLLEDAWMHRQNWILGCRAKINSHAHAGRIAGQSRNKGGPTPMGKLIVFDDRCAYGVLNPYNWLKHTPSLYPESHDGHLHQKYSRYEGSQFPIGVRIQAKQIQGVSAPAKVNGKRLDGSAKQQVVDRWAVDEPFQPRAMVLAGDVLFMAGWLDALAIQEKTGRAINSADPDLRPAVLRAVATADGRRIAQYKLNSEPVFDGMAAARGRLYLPLKDGSVLCMGAAR